MTLLDWFFGLSAASCAVMATLWHSGALVLVMLVLLGLWFVSDWFFGVETGS